MILVDGGSVDGTVDVAREVMPGIRIFQQTRKGKGNALAVGFENVTGDVVVMFDADGSADAREIECFVAALLNGADFAKGSRFMSGGSSVDITRVRKLGNDFLSGQANLAFRQTFSDLCYGYNAFWADQIGLLDLPSSAMPTPPSGGMLWGDGFEIETVINCRFAASGAKIAEVPSVELARIHGESNLNAVRDGVRVLRTIYSERVRARRIDQDRERDFDDLTRHATRRALIQRSA